MKQRTHTGVIPTPTESVVLSEQQWRSTFMIAALLLDYPGADFCVRLAAITPEISQLPAPIAERFSRFLAAAEAMTGVELEAHYVDTFDQRRRCSLYLSYYAVGDTRQRGAAILAFKEAIETLGFHIAREELPDHLCVVLEAAARAEGESHLMATGMLAAHRDGIEVLRHALAQLSSPYEDVVTAVCAALPPIDDQIKANFLELIRSGPPMEMVGITTELPFPSAQPDLL